AQMVKQLNKQGRYQRLSVAALGVGDDNSNLLLSRHSRQAPSPTPYNALYRTAVQCIDAFGTGLVEQGLASKQLKNVVYCSVLHCNACVTETANPLTPSLAFVQCVSWLAVLF
ncbi:MAG: hypothetical protein AAF471_08045, partial [Myxococcota bacterium]